MLRGEVAVAATSDCNSSGDAWHTEVLVNHMRLSKSNGLLKCKSASVSPVLCIQQVLNSRRVAPPVLLCLFG